jgi:hypothetical protein
MADYPNHVRVGATRATVFERRPDLYCRREAPGDAIPSGAVAIITGDEEQAFVVYRGRPERQPAAEEAGPVYSAGADGPLAVLTGRVFIRFAEGIRPEERRDEIAAAGFEIERTLSYAPAAAWLRPRGQEAATGLSTLSTLEEIPGVLHLEPQMLMARALRE